MEKNQMSSPERRDYIIKLLGESTEPVNATVMAEHCGVSRQIIVSDIALLRAGGSHIVSEKRGYMMVKPLQEGHLETIICRHDSAGALAEFYAVVDNGGKVLNVIVEHPLYGQISADLNILSRYDAEEFVARSKECGATQLADLTGGIHIHTISVPDSASFARITRKLDELGILYKEA